MRERNDALELVKEILDSHKAEDIVEIDVKEKTPFSDVVVIATAINPRSLSAIGMALEDGLSEKGYSVRTKEGEPDSGWIVIDTEGILVHVFLEGKRKQYGLDDLLSKPKK